MVGSRLIHELKCYVLRAMLIEHKSVSGEMVDSWQVSTDLVAYAIRRNDASCTLRNWEKILQ